MMSKLKIDKGASRVRRVPLKTTIDGTVADDIELMCQWSENETNYVVNHLLRFALGQSADFQKHKESLTAKLVAPVAPTSERTTSAAPALQSNKETR